MVTLKSNSVELTVYSTKESPEEMLKTIQASLLNIAQMVSLHGGDKYGDDLFWVLELLQATIDVKPNNTVS